MIQPSVVQPKSKHRWSRLTLPGTFAFLVILCFGSQGFGSQCFGSQGFGSAAGKKQTFTGEVGDAMCGRSHMQGTPAECTRTCVAKGSKYALVVGEKIYKLETSDKKILGLLDQQAGKNVIVTGTLDGDSITVSTAAAAK